MRVYFPATMQLLVQIVETGEVPRGVAYAVTPELREWYVEGDDEELEYAAMAAAAHASLQLLARRPDDFPRRAVLALDVPDGRVVPDSVPERGAVRLAAPTPLSHVVSAHVDGADASYDVRAALSALPAAAAGDEDAQFVVDAVEDHDLAWYANQELGALVAVES